MIPNNDHIPTTLNLDILRQKDLWHLLPKTHKMFVKYILNDWFRKKQTKSFGIVWAKRIRSNLMRIFLVNAWQNRNAFRLTFWPWIQGLAVIFRICTGSRFVCMHIMNISTDLQQCNAILHNNYPHRLEYYCRYLKIALTLNLYY